jgi:hypothetical protein
MCQTDENREIFKNIQSATPYVVPFVSHSLSYGFEFETTVSSVAGPVVESQ